MGWTSWKHVSSLANMSGLNVSSKVSPAGIKYVEKSDAPEAFSPPEAVFAAVGVWRNSLALF